MLPIPGGSAGTTLDMGSLCTRSSYPLKCEVSVKRVNSSNKYFHHPSLSLPPRKKELKTQIQHVWGRDASKWDSCWYKNYLLSLELISF